MDFVITLIADPKKAPLTEADLDAMAQTLETQGARVTKRQWLKAGEAAEIVASGQWPVVSEIENFLAADIILQPHPKPRYRLLIADMESTMITCECLDELAEFVGLRDKIEAITARAMNGELDFEAALRERVGLLAGLPESALQQVYEEKVRPMPGARELVAAMKQNGAHAMLVSGGFDFYAERVAKMLGFDEWRANRLEIENGKLTGKVIPPILGKEAKLAALQEACKKLNIAPAETLAIGDGANDLPMLLSAGLGVAYHAKPNVRAQVRARVDYGDLRALVFVQGFGIQDSGFR